MAQRKYFGTDGIRGRYGKDPINEAFFYKLGYALGCMLTEFESNAKHSASKRKPKVLIAMDTRQSGEQLARACAHGLDIAEANVYFLGVAPTPAVAKCVREHGADSGIMISASHNPYHDNGIKFFNHAGYKLSDEQELEIERILEYINRDNATLPVCHQFPTLTSHQNMLAIYEQDCCKQWSSDAKTATLTRTYKVVLDCANGAYSSIAPEVISRLGFVLDTIYAEPDGKNINLQCGSTHITNLAARVRETHADLGIAFDGDGDRVLMVDERGKLLDGDEILYLLATSSIHSEQTTAPTNRQIVGTQMSNLGFERALQKAGISLVRTKVGDRYVLEAMQRIGATLGGENSGHIINLEQSTTGDGLVTAIKVLRVLIQHNKPLSEWRKKLKMYPQILINIRSEYPGLIMGNKSVVEQVKKVESWLGEKGRVLLRPSGTEPLIRVMVEGEDENEVRKHAEFLAEYIRDLEPKLRCDEGQEKSSH